MRSNFLRIAAWVSAVVVESTKVRAAPASYDDHYSQVAMFYRSLSPVEQAHVAEAYSFDAVSQLGYLAAKTTRVQLASGILQIYTRTPTLTAMTA